MRAPTFNNCGPFQTFHRYAQFKSFQSLADSRKGNLYFGSSECAIGVVTCAGFSKQGSALFVVLNCMVTSNHVHLLVKDTGPNVIAQSI